MIIREENRRKDSVLTVACQMMIAIRTAPKARGVDNIETCIIEGEELLLFAQKMRSISKELGMPFFERDAKNVESSECMVLVGAKLLDQGLNCGFCGYDTCVGKQNAHLVSPCAFVGINLGIALGSAVSICADNRVDNRILYSAGKAAIELGIMPDSHMVLAIPMSSKSKSQFFDRG